LDHLLNKLVDAESSIGFYQRESEKLRKAIHDLLDGTEQLATEAKEKPDHSTLEPPEPDPHGLAWEKSTATVLRCFCGAVYADTAAFYEHLGAMKEPEPYRYQAGDGHP
jgi:hypothetical protein